MRPFLLASLLAAGSAFANPYLNQAKAFQQQLDFEKCLRRLEQASRWQGNTKPDLAAIELYGGLCEAGLGHETEALDHFELGFTLDPKMELPPQQGPKITALFKKAKDKAPPPEETPMKSDATSDVPKQEPQIAPPPPPPPEERKVEIETVKTTHVAAPIIIGAAGIVAAAVGVTFGVIAKSNADQAHMLPKSTFEMVVAAQLADAQTQSLISNVLLGVAGAALVVALITYLALN